MAAGEVECNNVGVGFHSADSYIQSDCGYAAGGADVTDSAALLGEDKHFVRWSGVESAVGGDYAVGICLVGFKTGDFV